MAGNNTINDSLMKYHGITLTMEMEYLYDENLRHWKKDIEGDTRSRKDNHAHWLKTLILWKYLY